MKKLILLIALIAFCATPVLAKEVTASFTWTPNPVEDNITGYKLYKDCGSEECVVATILDPEASTYTLTFEDENVPHTFSLTAFREEFDGDVTESQQSDYAVVIPKKVPPGKTRNFTATVQ